MTEPRAPMAAVDPGARGALRSGCAVVLGIVLLCVGVLWARHAWSRTFSPTGWSIASDAGRVSMAEDLDRSRRLIGMTRQQVVDLLGQPDPSELGEFYYIVGWDIIDPIILEITLDEEGVVVDAVVRGS